MKTTSKKEKGKYSPEKYIEINPTDDVDPVIKEAMNRTAVITFGRMNPLQQGHEKLVNKLVSVASKEKAIPLVYLSHTQDKKKNPLTYTDKLKFAKIAFGPIVKESQAKTILQAVKELQNNFNRLILVVGSDRVSEFDTLLNKYNGTEYKFDEIKVISAGTRDPDADDIAGMSASKMRTLAMEGNFKQFKNALPTKLRDSAEVVYKSVREGMGIMEDLDEARNPLTIAQRRKRGITMRRYRNRMKIAREKAQRKMASPDKLKMRAQRKARGIIRDRLMKSKKYSEMSPAEKIALDKRMTRISPTAISRIATRQLPIVRKAEMQRLADRRKAKTEETDLNTLFEQFVNEPQTNRKKSFRYLFTREGKVNYDQRMKMFHPKVIMGEDLEEALYELIEAVEALDKNDPLNREEGSDSLVKILKKDTPGEELGEDMFSMDEAFEFRFVTEESMLDKAVSAIRRHVLKGKDLGDVIWEFDRLVGGPISTKQLYNTYIKAYGNPYDRPSVSKEKASRLRRKYGFSESTITEGVNDPSIFKAVFLAGGPGSGKSFIVGKTALSALGFKVINSDDAFEAALAKAGMKPTPEDICTPKGQELRGRAKALTKTKMGLAQDGRLGLVIDGTGKDYEKIVKQAAALREIGYEVAMIFVNTDLDSALTRNRMRSRSLPDTVVEKMWKDVQKNLGKFQNFFRQQMYIVDNSEGSNYEGAVLGTYKKISTWAKRKPESSAAIQWIKSQRHK